MASSAIQPPVASVCSPHRERRQLELFEHVVLVAGDQRHGASTTVTTRPITHLPRPWRRAVEARHPPGDVAAA